MALDKEISQELESIRKSISELPDHGKRVDELERRLNDVLSKLGMRKPDSMGFGKFDGRKMFGSGD